MKFFSIFTLFIVFQVQAQDPMGVHFIDVGQGSATLLEFSCGTILIDTGGEDNSVVDGKERLKSYLQTFFKRRSDLNKTIDLLVLTHAHIDHTYGAKYVFDTYTVKNVITNGRTFGSGKKNQNAIQDAIKELAANGDPNDDIGYYEAIADNIDQNGTTSTVIDPLGCANGDPQVHVYWGRMLARQGLNNTEYNNGNNQSVVMKVTYGGSSILITGDLEEDAIDLLVEQYENELDVDLYVVGHHASRNGSTVELMEAMTPEIAVMSFGDPRVSQAWTAWAYGHPNVDIVEMLQGHVSGTRAEKEVWVGDGAKNFYPIEVDKAIYGTGWDGSIYFDAGFDGTWSDPVLTPTKFLTGSALINVNSATQAELETLPSIGPTRARAIIDHRLANGPFASEADLLSVSGIGPATISQIRDLIVY